ncbi:hypothetical protein AKO1_009479 [Acrasis kona]|uniref:Uncharacterized protein n=1 Tax=Acrasis kona TaxID=1008807 RepID=A0AAW2ZN81_9EUKA
MLCHGQFGDEYFSGLGSIQLEGHLRIKHVCVGSFVLIATDENDLWVCHTNPLLPPNLKSSIFKNSSLFQKIESDLITGEITHISSGEGHFIVVVNSSKIIVFGSNNCGEIGLQPNQTNISALTSIRSPSPEKRISHLCTGGFHSLVVFDGKEMYATGWNYYGSLGINCARQNVYGFEKVILSAPIQSHGIKLLSAGSAHTALITNNNELWAVGCNEKSCLGDNTINNRKIFLKTTLPEQIKDKQITQLSCGLRQTCFVVDDVDLFVMGSNDHMQCGIYGENVITIPTKVDVLGPRTRIDASFNYNGLTVLIDGFKLLCFNVEDRIKTNFAGVYGLCLAKGYYNSCTILYKNSKYYTKEIERFQEQLLQTQFQQDVCIITK